MRKYLLLLSATLARMTSQQPSDNKKDDAINAKVYVAAYKGDIEAINKLKSVGCGNMAPIYCAAQEGNVEATTALIAAGANVNTPQDDSRTPVFIAAQFGHAEVIRVLYEAGADVNTPEQSMGGTPVYMAAYNGHAAAIMALTKAGANVNTPTTRIDATPIYVAVHNGHVESVRALLNAGANASIGISQSKKEEELIVARWFSPDHPLLSGVLSGLFSDLAATMSLTFKAMIGSPKEGNTPLNVAIAQRGKSEAHEKIAKLLEMHFLQNPKGVKRVLVKQYNPPMLTQFHSTSKPPISDSTTILSQKKRTKRYVREL